MEIIPRDQTTVWFDIDHLIRHQGYPRGIPRVVSCILKELLENHPQQVKLCQFRVKTGHFHEVPQEFISEFLARSQKASSGHKKKATTELAAQSKSLLQKKLWDLSVHLWEFGWHLKGLFREAWKFTKVLIWLILQAFRKISWQTSGSRAVFQRGDYLVFTGGMDELIKFAEVRTLKQTGVQIAALVHDIIPINAPHLCSKEQSFRFAEWFDELTRQTDLLITTSNHNLREFAHYFEKQKLAPPRMAQFRLGDDFSQSPQAIFPEGLTQEMPAGFVLMVSAIEARKNQQVLYQTWQQLVEQYGEKTPHLVLVGGVGYLGKELAYQIENNPATKPFVTQLVGISDSELTWLYKNCRFTVFPTLYEGWGLPVAESLAFGKYCIASNQSSVPEVGGKVVDYHHPLDTAELIRLIELAMDNEYLAGKSATIKEQHQLLTWKESAEQFWRAFSLNQGKMNAKV
ncbi:MAG: glycosyltransferase [Zavarzinella sp.]